jgi:hypothetical protein
MAFDIHRNLFDGYWLDEDAAAEYEDQLCELFLASPEAAALDGDGGWLRLMLHYAFRHVRVTPATMDEADLEEIVFDIFPRKVSCSPDSAAEIVRELAAFFAFAGRAFGLPRAADCVALLDAAAEASLRRELANPENFGIAKSFVMSGHAAGVDLNSNAGLEAWTKTFNRNLVAHHRVRQSLGPEQRKRDRNRPKRDRRKR